MDKGCGVEQAEKGVLGMESGGKSTIFPNMAAFLMSASELRNWALDFR